MNLVRAETRRLFKRRVTRYMLLFMVLACATIAIGFSLSSQKIDSQRLAVAESEARSAEEDATRQANVDRMACERAHEPGAAPDDRFPADLDCNALTGPQPGTFELDWYLPYEFNFREEFDLFIAIFACVLTMFGLVVGASFVGAEWNTGGMMNLLLWRPRRLTVLLTKLGVLLGGVAAVGVVLGALWTTTFWLLGQYDGRPGHLTAGVWRSFALDGVRGLGLALIVAAVAFGLASIGKHTGMALGAILAVGMVSEIGIRIVVTILGVSFGDRYVLSTYVTSWFLKKYELIDWDSCTFSEGQCEPKTMFVTWQDSAMLFGAGTMLVLVLASWLMRRRDIT